MGTSNGSAWVIAQLNHRKIYDSVTKSRHDNRNVFIVLDELNDVVLWQRDPDELGRGVSRHNVELDFFRFIANGVLTIPASTVERERRFNFPYRDIGRMCAQIIAHGWNLTKIESDAEVQAARHGDIIQSFLIHQHADGSMSGVTL